MGEQRDREMDAETAKEEEEEGHPSHVLNEGRVKATVAKTIFHQGEAEVACTREDDGTSQPDFETLHVKAVRLKRESEYDVIDDREDSRGGDTVVGEHVRHHGDLVVHGSARPQENAKLLSDGAHAPPIDERVEYQLVASIRVFLPSIQLVVHGK